VKPVPVSTTTNPVTHEAEVAVNRASVSESGFAESLSALYSNAAPIMIKAPKKMIGKASGEYENFRILIKTQISVLSKNVSPRIEALCFQSGQYDLHDVIKKLEL
jgi:hypothetical protein